MAFNLSTAGNSNRISLGTGLLYLTAWGGVTPTVSDDIGYGRGAQLTVTRQKTEVRSGTPRQRVVQYAIQEDVTLQFTSLEWNVTKLSQLLGYDPTTAVVSDTLGFGGSMAFTPLQLRFIHQMPPGGTVTVDMWKAEAQGELTLNFQEDVHEFPFNFAALYAVTDWGGTTITGNKNLFQIRVQIA